MTDKQIDTTAELLGVSPSFLAKLERDLAAPVEPRPSRDDLRWPYEPMDDETWSIVAPIWGEARQAKVPSRAIVDALLMKATTGCPWDAVARYAPPEAVRNQLRRRSRSGQWPSSMLPPSLPDSRLRRGRLYRWLEAFASRKTAACTDPARLLPPMQWSNIDDPATT